MNDDISKMVRKVELEVGFKWCVNLIELERFAALVAAAKEAELMDSLTIAYMDGYEKGKDAGAAAERKACCSAEVLNAANINGADLPHQVYEKYTAAIMARGNT